MRQIHTHLLKCIFSKGQESQFSIQQQNSTTQNLPYDYYSVMHFKRNQFSTHERRTTVKPTHEEINANDLGLSGFPSVTDYLHVRFLYCEGTGCAENHIATCILFVSDAFRELEFITYQGRI